MPEAAHFIGHRDGLRGALTVRENLLLTPELMGSNNLSITHGLSITGASDRLRLDHLLDLPVSVLSAGQRRRTALARLLVAQRPIWLLDEPTSSLDAASVTLTAQIIGDHLAGGGIVLAATHLPLGLTHPRELVFAADGTHTFADPRP
jgi:heme exporter protein A